MAVVVEVAAKSYMRGMAASANVTGIHGMKVTTGTGAGVVDAGGAGISTTTLMSVACAVVVRCRRKFSMTGMGASAAVVRPREIAITIGTGVFAVVVR
jgi:hypothetical protein